MAWRARGTTRILREAIVPNGGWVPRTGGDAFFAVFPSAVRAVAAGRSAARARSACLARGRSAQGAHWLAHR
jgi:class 3 adenylate cyclase